KPGTSSWVEPTAHTLVALKRASSKFESKELDERVRLGEAQLAGVRSKDGGWNYGSRAALGIELPSSPDTMATQFPAPRDSRNSIRRLCCAPRQVALRPTAPARPILCSRTSRMRASAPPMYAPSAQPTTTYPTSTASP